MNTDDFQFFIRVADCGSLSKAAQEANVSVSVASQRIQRLETTLKLRLFYRTTRKITLTDEGKKLLDFGRYWIDDFINIKDALTAHDRPLTGTLRVTTSATFGIKILTKVVTNFALLHPTLNIYLDLNDQNIDLIEHGMDLAIRIGKLNDSSLIAKPLITNHRLICAAPSYLNKYGMPESIEDLQQHRCILQQHQNGLTDHWKLIDQHRKVIDVHLHAYFTTNSGEAIRQAALQGLGISNHSRWHVAEDLEQGHLIEVLPEYQIESTTIYAVFPNRQFRQPKTELFLSYLQNYFEYEYPWKIILKSNE